MSTCCVKFFTTVLSSDGHPHKALQRAIIVSDPQTPQDAAQIAQQDFERLEMIPDWRLHADCYEVVMDGPR
jgi:hypothetical protein